MSVAEQYAGPELVIFGASHVGIRLAERIAAMGRRARVIDRVASPVADPAWVHVCSDFAVPATIGEAKLVYAVTDEDEVNIRIALAVRRVHATVPIVIALTQSRLGEKLARHLAHFSFVNPPELAAARFVEAIYAEKPVQAGTASMLPVPVERDEKDAWHPDPLVLRAVLFIAAIGVLATVYFHMAERLAWVDALYFVVTMMATVGFGDISLRDSSVTSKLVGVAVMITSIVNTAVIFALITDSLLKRRLVLSFGRRRVRESGHVVVAGIGSVGWRVVEQLRARGEQVVVIDSKEGGRYLTFVYAKRVPTIIGDARLERTLRDAGLVRAKALLSMTNDDLANLEVGLNAKVLNPDMRVVLRIFDHELAHSLRDQLDIHFAFGTSSIAAEVLARFVETPPG